MNDPFDNCEWLPARELFRRLGFEPVPPAELDDFQLRGRLWEFVYALAGRRIYLTGTDHLGDRELYTRLHDRWFEETTPDVPPEAEWNCRIDFSEYGESASEKVWLTYYADEFDRQDWTEQHPDRPLPARVDPPHDRDRWLPEPSEPQPDEDDDSDVEGGAEDDHDPLGLHAVDAQIRRDQEEARSLAEADSVVAEVWERPVDRLKQKGITLLPPDELTDETLPAKLWELLHNLACQGFWVLNTDHLSDRQLYEELWRHGLRDEALLPGKCRTGGWYHDFVGGGSEDDELIRLRYYASDEERAEAVEDLGAALPAKEAPSHRRDWRLPKGPI